MLKWLCVIQNVFWNMVNPQDQDEDRLAVQSTCLEECFWNHCKITSKFTARWLMIMMAKIDFL